MHHLLINNIGFSTIMNGIEDAQIPRFLCGAFINCIVIVGVNLFFLLSGYFGIKFKLKKILLLLGKVYVFWGIGIILKIMTGMSTYELIVPEMKRWIFCITEYWYIIVYIVLTFLSPLLNCIVERISEKQIVFFMFQYLAIGCGIYMHIITRLL